MKLERESIFTSAVRTFAVTISAALGLVVILLFVGKMVSGTKGSVIQPPPSQLVQATDENGERVQLADDVIARINIHGVIGSPTLTTERLDLLLNDAFSGAIRKGRTKALLLHINTPGGTAVQAHGMYSLVKQYKQKYGVPVYAYVDGLCASGGMFIAAAADQIYASDPSIIGSVGVILGPNFNYAGGMEKLGITAKTITQGKDKDALNPFREWKENEAQGIEEITKALYKQFVAIVASERPKLTEEKLEKEFGANVYIAEKAEELGYIDHSNISYYETLSELSKVASVSKYQVITLRRPQSSINSILGNEELPGHMGKFDHVIHLGEKTKDELQDQFLYYFSHKDM